MSNHATNDVVVRTASESDIAAIALLVQRYWQFEHIAGFEHAAVAEQVRRLIDHEAPGAVLLADSAAGVIGYLLLVYVFSLEHLGLTAEIDELYVEPGFRSRGVGAALLKDAECAAANAGCTNISLQLGRHNERGNAFYRREGYALRDGYTLLEKNLKGC